jgi:hypothetical protein
VLIQGLAPPTHLGVFNNTVDNAYRAFAERYFTCKVGTLFLPALPTSFGEWAGDEIMKDFCEELNANLQLVPIASIEEVVDCYKGAKRKVYQRAADQFWSDGVRRMDAELRSFGKFEKCDLGKASRVINPRHPVYNLALGRFLKKNEHAYFDALAKVFNQKKVVMKGIDTHESARLIEELWDEYDDACAIGGDASKFDMHVSTNALFFEHLCYIRPYCSSYNMAIKWYFAVLDWIGDNPDGVMPTQAPMIAQLCWLLAQQLVNTGRAYFDDGKLKFTMYGTRSSGDLNTSLGNCILMCSMTYGWKRISNVMMGLVNNGDDCQYIMDSASQYRWRSGFNEYYARKGFRMVLEDTVHDLESVEFCQSKPVITADGLKMVRNPCTLVSKGSMCLLPVQNIKTLRKWMMAIGIAEGSLARGVPVLQSFARAMRRNGIRCTKRLIANVCDGSSRLYNEKITISDLEISNEARISFNQAWGVTPDEQLLLESYYDNWTMEHEFGTTIPGCDAYDRVGVQYAPATSLL